MKPRRIFVAFGLVVVYLLMAGGSLLKADDGDGTLLARLKRHRHHRVTTTTTTTTTTVTGRSIDELQGDVSNLRQQSAQTTNEVKKIEQEITVAPPATAGAAPATIGQHVSAVEKDLGDIKKNLSDNLGVHIHGLVDSVYDYNLNEPNTAGTALAPTGGRVNQLRTFDVDANSFTFQQFNLHVDRTMEGGVGFVVDLNFGKTAEVLRNATHYSNTGLSNDLVDPTQAYVTYTVPVGKGINLSAGKFVTLLGEEIIDVYNNQNFNESHSFNFGFGIPFTHTGVRAQYSFTDKIGLTMGVNNGWDDPSDNNDGKSLEGQLALTPFESLSATISGTYGPEQANHGNSKRGIIDPIVTWKTPLKGLQLIGEYDYGHEDGPVAVTPFVTASGNMLTGFKTDPLTGLTVIPHGVDWQGFVGYAVYDFTDQIEFAGRFEWFRDSDGSRTGLRQTLYGITGTLNYKVPIVSGLLARLEYRHDASSAQPFYSNDALKPPPLPLVPTHTYSGQDTILAGAIYAF